MVRRVILIGFMGTGKTAVGRELARILGGEFVDLDEEVVRRAGLPVAEIFLRRGEGWFRRAEKEALATACRGASVVIAAGGGAACDAENLLEMRSAGTVVLLRAEPETILSRLEGDVSRPLLSGGDRREAVERLLAEREAWYSRADLAVATDGKDPGEVARSIARLVRERG